MAVRTQSGAGQNPNMAFELISQRLGGLEKNVKTVKSQIANMGSQMNGPGLTVAAPNIPLVIAEEVDQGLFKETVSIRVPNNAYSVKLHFISVFQNTLQSGETQAQAIQRAKAHILPFTLKITDAERLSGYCIQQIGPFKRKTDGNADKNRYQLLDLVSRSQKGGDAAYNPTPDPYGTFPFATFKIQTDNTGDVPADHYFELGANAVTSKPSPPSSANIVYNQVNLETTAIDATVRFRLYAKTMPDGITGDPTGSFGAADITNVEVLLHAFTNQIPQVGTVQNKRVPATISDPSVAFIDVETDLRLGAHYQWHGNIYYNSGGMVKVLATSVVGFYFGGSTPSAGIPELGTGLPGATPVFDNTAFTISAAQQDNGFTELTITVKQSSVIIPPASTVLATLCKRINIFKTEPGGTKKELRHLRIPLLEDETFFVPSTTTTFIVLVKHKARLTGIKYDAEIVGINSTAATPIKRAAAQVSGDSTFAGKPTPPNTTRFGTLNVVTMPDEDTADGTDSYADFQVGADTSNAALKFSDVGTDHIHIVLAKGAEPTDTRIPHLIFPITPDIADQTSATFRVRNLRTSHQYTWVRNIALRSGVSIKSPINPPTDGNFVTFRAGVMIQDLTGVGLVVNEFVQEAKRHGRIKGTITQPATPAYLRALKAFVDLGDGRGFVFIHPHTVLRTLPEAQIPGMFNFEFKVPVRPKAPNQRCYVQLLGVGGGSKDTSASPTALNQTLNGGGGEPPTMAPSTPMWSDIISNIPQGDVGGHQAKTTFRVYASDMRNSAVAGGTGPGGSISWNDTGATAIKIVLVDPGDPAGKHRYTFETEIQDFTSNFQDCEKTELPMNMALVWRVNVAKRNEVPLKSVVGDVAFNAGGMRGTAGLPELANATLTLSYILSASGKNDPHHINANLNYTQGMAVTIPVGSRVSGTIGQLTLTGNGSCTFLSTFRPGYAIIVGGFTYIIAIINSDTSLVVRTPLQTSPSTANPSGNYTGLTVGILIKSIFYERKLNNGTFEAAGHYHALLLAELQDAGAHIITKQIHHPKKSPLDIRATIIGVGDTPANPLRRVVSSSGAVATSVNTATPDEKSFEDAGAPIIPVPKQPFIRWKPKGLRIGFVAPGGEANNMNTHSATRCLLYFQLNDVANTFFLWDPIGKRTVAIPFSGGPPNPLVAGASQATIKDYLIDLNKGAILHLNNDIPTTGAEADTEIDATSRTVWNDLSAGTAPTIKGFLFGLFFVYNQFNGVETGTMSSVAVSLTIQGGFTVVNNTYS